MGLPYFQTQDEVLNRLQTQWISQLNPILSNPILAGGAINNVTISSGSSAVINHLLGRKQIGWIITDQSFPAKIARIAPLNDKTLTLSSDATTVVALWVF